MRAVILNIGKCHYVSIDKDVGENKTLQISSQQSKEVEILRITIDQKLFHQHIKNICKKADQKQSALLRTRN